MPMFYFYGAVNGDGERMLIAKGKARTRNEVRDILVGYIYRYDVEIVSFGNGIYTPSDLYAGRSGIRCNHENRQHHGISC